MERFVIRLDDESGWFLSVEDPHCQGIVFTTFPCPKAVSQHLQPIDIVEEWVNPEDYLGQNIVLAHEDGMRIAIALAALQGTRAITPTKVWLLMMGAFRMASEEVLYWFTKTCYGRPERSKAFRRAVREILEVA